MITLIILCLSLTAYSQVTTKAVKISTLVKMGKDLEKCEKVLKPELALKSHKIDALVIENLETFSELKLLRIENETNQERLKELNASILKATKTKKKNWVLPTLIGIAGFSGGVLIAK